MTSAPPPPPDCDLAIVGAGLAGGLIALAMAARRPERHVLLLDGADHAGGNHVWSYFDSDMSDEARELLAPLVSYRWERGHEVHFPRHQRKLATPYNSISSSRFDAHLRSVLGARLRLSDEAVAVSAQEVSLASGAIIRARAVIDARGFPPGQQAEIPGLSCGWQKFVGQRLLLAAPHGLDCPVIMDARVEQIDGYRFVYVLPLGQREIFVEDTYYSDTPDLDVPLLRTRIADYARASRWTIEAVAHEETGILPVAKGGDFERFWPSADKVARAGVRAGLFHPVTGYSLPFATEFALWLAKADSAEGEALARSTRQRAATHWRGGGYYRLLATMLFDAAPPCERYRIFERFYRLPPPLIARFYGGRSTWADKIRILCGRPPVRIRAAMRALWNRNRA